LINPEYVVATAILITALILGVLASTIAGPLIDVETFLVVLALYHGRSNPARETWNTCPSPYSEAPAAIRPPGLPLATPSATRSLVRP
jgi:hypothetical protein